MNTEDGPGDAERIDGLPIEDAVDAVVARDDAHDPETVRAALETVAEDGVVGWTAAEEELAHVSKVVSTPETRIEFASMALTEAREAAEPVGELDVVRSRLDALESRLTTLEERTDGLGRRLQRLVERTGEPGALFDVAVGIRRLTEAANEAHRAADELKLDVEKFQAWVEDPDERFDELGGDVDALESALDDLAEAADGLADPDATEFDRDADAAWAEATLRTAVMELLLADLRAELAEHRRWLHRVGEDYGGRADELARRLDGLDDRQTAIAERLDDLARQSWRARHGDRVADFEATLETVEPPVEWGDVEAELDSHLSALARRE